MYISVAKRRGLQATSTERGLFTILAFSMDTGWDPAVDWNGGLWAALAQVDVFLPNELETYAITGQGSEETALAALAEHVPVVAVKLGAEGAIDIDPNGLVVDRIAQNIQAYIDITAEIR
jgi:sugar/nucleoside kinase (ribokinase family)